MPITTSPVAASAHTNVKPTKPIPSQLNRLPVELLHMILDHYSSYRLQEVKDNHANRDTSPPPPDDTEVRPEWPIVPIIQTCSLFRDLMIPNIYRDVYLIGNTTVEKFCSQPALTSYKYLNELVIRGADGEADIPAKCLDKANEARSFNPRFEVGTVRLRGASMRLAPGLLSMFDMRHLVIEDFYLNDESYTYLALRHCPWITLICRVDRRYRTRKGLKIYTDTNIPPIQVPIKLELQIGWEDASHREYISSRGRAHLAVDTVSDLVLAFSDRSVSQQEVVISPYMGKNGGCHKWCFGKNIPKDVEAPPGCLDIRFTSSCLCGNGDQTGFWKGLDEEPQRYTDLSWAMTYYYSQ